MVSIVHDNKLYVANAGDSKAALLRKTADGYVRVKVSKTFNANKKYEQERLRKEHPGETDIVVCKRGGEGACYVKGNLMPSRAFGDLRLKHAEFNFHNYSLELGYRKPHPRQNYSGNYISHVPDVQVFDLTEEDKYLVLASDGLWDEFNRKKAAEIAQGLEEGEQHELTSKTLANQLLNDCLTKAAEKNGITRAFLGQVRPGTHKRGLVDDITIVVLDLKNQFKK